MSPHFKLFFSFTIILGVLRLYKRYLFWTRKFIRILPYTLLLRLHALSLYSIWALLFWRHFACWSIRNIHIFIRSWCTKRHLKKAYPKSYSNLFTFQMLVNLVELSFNLYIQTIECCSYSSKYVCILWNIYIYFIQFPFLK